MLFITYVNFIFSHSIEYSFQEIAIASSFKIEQNDFEKNGCILWGFYMITCEASQEKLFYELERDAEFDEVDWDEVESQICNLGYVSALRLFSVSKLLSEEHEYSHEKFKTEILEILVELNKHSRYIIKYLNERTSELIRATDFYNYNISEFFIKYFNFFGLLFGYNSLSIRLLYINYIIISKKLLTDDNEQLFFKDYIKDRYNGIHSLFYDFLEYFNLLYDHRLKNNGFTLDKIRADYQEIYKIIDRH